MRKPRTSTTPRLVCAGLTAGAVVAALFVAPSAAWASAPTLSPTSGPAGTVITATHADIASADGIGAIFTTNTTCPDKYVTTLTGQTVVAATSPTKATSTTATFVVPSTLALGTNGVVKSYNVCVYNGTTLNTSTKIGDAVAAFVLTPTVTLSPTSGASGGGNTLTATLPATSALFTAAPGVRFTTGACPAAYDTAATGAVNAGLATRTSNTAATMVVPAGVLGTGLTTPFNVCFYANATTGTLLAATASAYNVTLPAITLSSSVGPIATTNNPVNLTLSSTTNFLTGITAPAAAFPSATVCPATYGASPTNPATVRKVANNKAAVSVPTSLNTVGQYTLCLYVSNASGARLVSLAPYSVATLATITSVSPSAGSSLGKATITVSGQNLPTTPGSITATLGGQPLTDVTPVDSTTFTAITPAHSPGSVPLTITTSTGTDSLAGAYTYVNSIQVTPNTTPSTSVAQDIDVSGTGFLDLIFPASPSTATTSTDAHVFLVAGVYNPTGNAATGLKANGPVTECGNVLVISDTELICTLNLTLRLSAAGAYVASSYRNVTDAATYASSNVLTSASAAFTSSDVGKPLTPTAGNTKIAAGTTIAAVIDSQTVLMSQNSVAAGSTISVDIGTTRTVSVTTSGTNTVTGSAVFTQADVGHPIANTGLGNALAANTMIIGVSTDGNTATLSKNVVNAISSATNLAVQSTNAVPDGVYNVTVVNNGAVDANSANAYVQTMISSGSTFTVADF